MAHIIQFLVILITLFVTGQMGLLLWQQSEAQQSLGFVNIIKLASAGFISNVADTVGIGSFAVLVAFNKYWRMVDDQELPGTLNAQSPLPTVCQALFFLTAVHVEMTTLITLIIASSFGGFIGGMVVSNLDKNRIRRLMFFGYLGIASIIIASKVGLLPVGGVLMALNWGRLMVAAAGMIIAGVLPAIGVGAYAPIQVILFLLGMSPLAAFPIMTSSAAFQQSVAAYVFVQRSQVPIKASFIIGIAGVVGVLVAAPFVTYVNSDALRWLLLAVVLYNVIMLWQSFSKRQSTEPALTS